MSVKVEYELALYKKYGHKWLKVTWPVGFRSVDVCIDDWFTYSHNEDVSCNTVLGWLPLERFSYSVDSVGHYVLHIPTCFGFHSTRNGRLRTTGDFHSYVVLRPHFFECVKNNF